MNHIIIGETCLIDKQLRRCGVVNSPHGCFDNVLVNLNAIESIIDDDFKFVIDKNYMDYVNYCYYPKHEVFNQKWINNKYSFYNDNVYSWDILSFFHLHSEEDWDALNRRLTRTKSWFEDDADIILYYYYRRHDKYDIDKHHFKLINLQEKISNKYSKNVKIFNINNIFGNDSIDLMVLNPSIYSINVTSNNSWIGIDDNWDAHLDNHLFDDIFRNDLVINFIGNL